MRAKGHATVGCLDDDDLPAAAYQQAFLNVFRAGYPINVLDLQQPLQTGTADFFNAALQLFKDHCGEDSVYVVSVLGGQSSYKSSILGALLGCQFSTGMGRCSRGIQASLHALTHHGEQDSKCDKQWVLVLDTEGTCGLEVAQHLAATGACGFHADVAYDNRIGMWAFGISHCVLFCAAGELHKTMQDQLQMCAYAMLVMEQVMPTNQLIFAVNVSLRNARALSVAHSGVQLAVDSAAKKYAVQHKTAHYFRIALLSDEQRCFQNEYSKCMAELKGKLISRPAHAKFTSLWEWAAQRSRFGEALLHHDFATSTRNLDAYFAYIELNDFDLTAAAVARSEDGAAGGASGCVPSRAERLAHERDRHPGHQRHHLG